MSSDISDYNNAFTRYQLISSHHKQKKRVGKVVNVIASESGDASTINNVAKVAKSGFGLLAAILPFEWLRNTSDFFNGVANAIKTVGIFKTSRDIKDNRNDGLKVASAALGGVSALGAGAKILNGLKIIHFAKFSSLLGSIPMIGSVLAKFLPIAVVLNVVDVAKAGVDIAQASKKIHRLRGARNSKNPDDFRNGYREMKSNMAFWSNVEENGMSKSEAEGRQNHLQAKLDDLNQRKDNLQAEKDTAGNTLISAFNKLESKEAKASDKKYSLSRKLKKFKATRAFKKAGNENLRLENKLNAIQKKIAKRTEEQDALQALEYTLQNPEIMDDDSAGKIKDFAKRKVERLKLKMSNNRWDQAKEGIGIALNIIIAVTLIGVSVLGGLALAGIAAVNLPISASFLLISLIGLGMHFLKKYKKNHSYSQVPFEVIAH